MLRRRSVSPEHLLSVVARLHPPHDHLPFNQAVYKDTARSKVLLMRPYTLDTVAKLLSDLQRTHEGRGLPSWAPTQISCSFIAMGTCVSAYQAVQAVAGGNSDLLNWVLGKGLIDMLDFGSQAHTDKCYCSSTAAGSIKQLTGSH